MSASTPFSRRFASAQSLFDRGSHQAAATALAELVGEVSEVSQGNDSVTPDSHGAEQPSNALLHGTAELRLLLARAYYHSAQLGRAEAVLRPLIEQCPTDAYAHLLLGRTLQRAGRQAEAARPLALARILGDYETPTSRGEPS